MNYLDVFVKFVEKYWKEICIIIIVLVLFLLIRKHWNKIYLRLFSKDLGNYDIDGDGTVDKIDTDTKKSLEILALNIKTDLDSTIWTSTSNIEKASYLIDLELKYLAKYYQNAFNKTLYSDLKEEWITAGSKHRDNLCAKLERIGFKI